MEVGDSGVEVQEFLKALPPPEDLLTSLLLSCRSVFLLNDVVTARRRDHLLVVNVSQTRNHSDRGSVTPEPVGMDDLSNIVFSQQPGQESLRRIGVPMPLKEDVEHQTVLVHGPPKPVLHAVHGRTHLIERPP